MSLEEMTFPQHYIVGGVYVKELILRSKGDQVLGHSHNFDHLSLLAKGTVQVSDGTHSVTYIAPTGVNIKAGHHHEITALTDDCLWYCIHAVPEGLRGEALLDDVVVKRA